MNSLSRKIIVALFAVMLSINFNILRADAVDHCESPSCLNCNGMMITGGKSTPIFAFADHMCHASSGNTPCNLNKNPEPNELTFIVSSINIDQQKTGGAFTFAIFETSLLQNVSENGRRGQFQVTTNTIPIYLQNLSLLC